MQFDLKWVWFNQVGLKKKACFYSELLQKKTRKRAKIPLRRVK